MSLIGVFISGETGRMGQEVRKLIDQPESPWAYAGGLSRQSALPSNIPAQIVVDFSLPEATQRVVEHCHLHRLPLVCGTTGLKNEHRQLLMSLSRDLPVFWASNMSFGVHIFHQLIRTLSQYQSQFQYQLLETHHIHKKDAPSGTARSLEQTARTSGLPLEKTQSLREGEVLGVHTLVAQGPMENLQISHEATDRRLFADGALKVGLWLKSQKPGFYSMEDFFSK